MMVCGKTKNSQKNIPRQAIRIGGPRYICMLEKGHEGACGDFKWMLQCEHADLMIK